MYEIQSTDIELDRRFSDVGKRSLDRRKLLVQEWESGKWKEVRS